MQETKTEEYNGWANKESWAFSLHINNNRGDYDFWTERAKELKNEFKLADELEEWAEDVFRDVIDGEESTQEARSMVADVGSLWRVDFVEVAKGFLEE